MKLEIGQVLSNQDVSRLFDVCAQRGIRYSGSLQTGIRHVVLITVLHKTSEDLTRIPYEDRKVGECLLYTGEGRYGNQKMSRGNLVLKQQMEKGYPIYVFERKSPGRYAFLGEYEVVSWWDEFQSDSQGMKRRVFMFELARKREGCSGKVNK
ncbi:MAG: YDG/SRA domain-containing protein [Candidatus Bathyarchaeia archaeon]